MKLRTFFVAAVFIWALGAAAQPYDTLYGEGQLRFLNAQTEAPVGGVHFSAETLTFGDMPYDSLHTGTADSLGLWPYTLPACILNLLSADDTPSLRLRSGIGAEVYPNPGSAFHAAVPEGRYRAALLTLSGKTVRQGQFVGTEVYFDLSGITEGVYMHRIERLDGGPLPTEIRHSTGKFIYLRTAPRPDPGTKKQSLKFLENYPKNELLKSDSTSCESAWQLTYSTPEGYVSDTTQFTVSQGDNDITDIFLTPWDTAYASGFFVTRDIVTNSSASFVPSTLTVVDMQDVSIPTTIEYPAVFGAVKNYENLPVSVDTLAQGNFSSAEVFVSWPDVIRHNLDSASVNPGYIGWVAGDTTLTFQPGVNTPQITFVYRQPPHDIIGKQYVAGHLWELKDGSPGSENVPTDSALVVISHPDGIDSTYTGEGYWMSPNAYPHGATVHLGMGYVGGENADGKGFKSYKGLPRVIEGTNYFKKVAGDSIQFVNAHLIPDLMYSSMNDSLVSVSALQYANMEGTPHYHAARFDTIAYYITPGEFTEFGESKIDSIAQAASIYTPIQYIRVSSPFSITPYDRETVTTFDHGANVAGGSNIMNIQQIDSHVQGIPLAYVRADVNTTAAYTTTWKELVGRSLGMSAVSNRPSMMNLTASPPNDMDFAIIRTKHNVSKEMFRYEWEGGYQGQMFKISPWISDDTNITPQ